MRYFTLTIEARLPGQPWGARYQSVQAHTLADAKRVTENTFRAKGYETRNPRCLDSL